MNLSKLAIKMDTDQKIVLLSFLLKLSLMLILVLLGGINDDFVIAALPLGFLIDGLLCEYAEKLEIIEENNIQFLVSKKTGNKFNMKKLSKEVPWVGLATLIFSFTTFAIASFFITIPTFLGLLAFNLTKFMYLFIDSMPLYSWGIFTSNQTTSCKFNNHNNSDNSSNNWAQTPSNYYTDPTYSSFAGNIYHNRNNFN